MPRSVVEAINLPELSALETAQQFHDKFSTLGQPQADTTLYTVRKIEQVLQGDNVKLAMVLQTIEDAAESNVILRVFRQTLYSTGLDFSIQNTQDNIAALAIAGSWPEDVLLPIQAIGTIPPKYYWEEIDLVANPPIEDIQAELLVRELGKVFSEITRQATQKIVATATAAQDAALVEFAKAIITLGG